MAGASSASGNRRKASGSTSITTTKPGESVGSSAGGVTTSSSGAGGRTRATTRKQRPTSKAKPTGEPPKYDFASTYVGPMCNLVTQVTQKSKIKYMTLTEWPASLMGAHRANVLTGEAEKLAVLLDSMGKGTPTE